MFKKIIALCLTALFLSHAVITQADDVMGTGGYVVTVDVPTYNNGAGPRILVDEGHNNYQTIADRFKGFADLMIADGASVNSLRVPISAKALADVDILVICNALNAKNAQEMATIGKWRLPAPNAFTDEEVKAISAWVRSGGSLLLIADHMPFPAAVENLGNAFGVVMQDNFAFAADFTYKPGDMNLIKFQQPPSQPNGDKLLEGVNMPYVVTFTGSAFRMKPGVAYVPILELGEGTKVAWPSDHAEISETTPFSAGVGLLQGVVLPVDSGKAAIFGEASLFSVNYATWWKNYPLGFQNPDAPYNKRFILDVMHWLAQPRYK
ncbi:MAG: hypothetical protein WC091_09080 [Sulfuricellaceae bacterium]